MGGGISKLWSWAVRDVVDPYPAEPGQRRDTVAISTSQTCRDTGGLSCRVGVPPNISTSSVVLKRPQAGEYSAKTKLFVEPSLPLKISWNGKVIDVTKMTLYHPFPLRIENVQYDAALSLNDPADGSTTVVLIPLVAASVAAPSVEFMDKLGPHVPRMMAMDPETKTYLPVTVPTGTDWMLTKMLPVRGNRIQSGFYQWFAGRGFDSYVDTSNPFIRHTRWRAREPRANYIVVETPANVSPSILSSILTLPRTDPLEAIAPLSPIVTYTPCANTPATGGPVRESFNPECDPFGPNAYKDTSAEKAQLLAKILGYIVSFIAIVIGVYVGLLLAGSQASIYTKEFGETAGGWIYKQVQSARESAGALKGNILESIASRALKV